MELVNGISDQKPHPEIIIGSLENNQTPEAKTALESIFSFLISPRAKLVQSNNTVFVYSLGTSKAHKEDAACWVYNIDLPDNYPANIVDFLQIVQKRGLKSVSFIVKDPSFMTAFTLAMPEIKKKGTKAQIEKAKNKDVYIATVNFGTRK
jgi:hypothetical protein